MTDARHLGLVTGGTDSERSDTYGLNMAPAPDAKEAEIARLRARAIATTIPEERERIVGKLAALGTVIYPEGSPEYAEYRTQLRAALAAWKFTD